MYAGYLVYSIIIRELHGIQDSQRRENFLRCEYVVIDQKVEEIIISVVWFIIFTILTVICQAPSQTTDNRI